MQISSSLFTWLGGQGTAEISDLPNNALIQVWPDSCDLGIEVVSSTTGLAERFAIDGEDKNDEGELIGIRLKPCSQALRARGISLYLFND